MNENKKLEIKYQELLNQYKSSHDAQQKINWLDETIKSNRDREHKLLIKLADFNNELDILKENRVLSSRQMESITFFKNKSVKAYPLRELIQLNSNAKLKDERRFNAIKYTIFFEGKDITPPNDLYHVPLMSIIPDRLVTELPPLNLEIKQSLSNDLMPIAIKALCWVEKFFRDTEVYIKDETLYDPLGIRGSQEKESYILSEKGLAARKATVESVIAKANEELQSIAEIISTSTKQIQLLNSIIQTVREAEAFMTAEFARTQLKSKLEDLRSKEIQLNEQLERLDEVRKSLDRKQIEEQSLEKELKEKKKSTLN